MGRESQKRPNQVLRMTSQDHKGEALTIITCRHFLFPFYPVAADMRSALLSQVAPVAGVTAFWRASADNAACVHFACLSPCLLRRLSPLLPLFSTSSLSLRLVRFEKPRSGRERQSDGKRQKRLLFHFSTRAAPVYHYVRRVEGSQSERLASLMMCDDSSVIRRKRP